VLLKKGEVETKKGGCMWEVDGLSEKKKEDEE